MNLLRIIHEGESPILKKLETSSSNTPPKDEPVKYPAEELKERLNPVQYRVTQCKGTEKPYSGQYLSATAEGCYQCIVCQAPLFSSDDKFGSGCGWPTFSDVIDQGRVKIHRDTSNGLNRLEVSCRKCGAHLGHVFDDGPTESHLRYCVNSASLEFKKHTTV